MDEYGHPFVVFVSHKDEPDMHLYTVLARDEAHAGQQAWQAFEREHAPDERDDWNVVAFQASFTGQPTYVTRVDSM